MFNCRRGWVGWFLYWNPQSLIRESSGSEWKKYCNSSLGPWRTELWGCHWTPWNPSLQGKICAVGAITKNTKLYRNIRSTRDSGQKIPIQNILPDKDKENNKKQEMRKWSICYC